MLVMRPAQGPRSKITLIHMPQNLKLLATQTIRTDVQNVRHIQQPRNAKPPLVHQVTTTPLNAHRLPEVDPAIIHTHRQLAAICQAAPDTAIHISEFKHEIDS